MEANRNTVRDGPGSEVESQPTTEVEDSKPAFPKSSILMPDTHNDKDEPTIHIRTWFALVAMFVFNFTGVLALNGPPTVVSRPFKEEQSRTKTN